MVKLAPREKMFLTLGGSVLGLFLVYMLGINPVLENYENMKRRITQKELELKELLKLKGEYVQNREMFEDIKGQLEKGKDSFSLLSFLETSADRQDISKDNIASMKPRTIPINETYSEALVEVRLDKVTLEQLIDYLYQFLNSKYKIHIKQIRIKTRFDNPMYHDVVFTASTIELS